MGLTTELTETAGARSGTVGLVLTGGTIASELTSGPDTDGLVRLVGQQGSRRSTELELLRAASSGQADMDFRVRRPVGLLSENLVPDDWLRIASSVRSLALEPDVDGVVVLHGTDTMAYTAAALSFLLTDLDAPVVLTGSNLPPNQPGSDAVKNIHDALVALHVLRAGVYLAFAGRKNSPGWVHVGTRVRKVRASGPAFRSINRLPVGKVVGESFLADHPLRRHQPHFPCHLEVDERVLHVRLHPGLDLAALFEAVDGRMKAVVVELYASATGPMIEGRYSVPAFIERCTANDVAVVTATASAPAGHAGVYESTLAMREAGAIFVGDMLPETALVKLMWGLSQVRAGISLREIMLTAVAEEIRPGGS